VKRTASEMLIGSLQVEVFAHATEDPAKVKHAISNIIPNLDAELQEENLRGHYDNPILLLRLRVEDEDQVERVVSLLGDKIELEQKKTLAMQLGQHLDERGWLYLRLDKQELYRGRIVFSDGDDVVKVRLSLAPHILRKHDPSEVYRLCGLIV
jgi:RNA-binding protein